MPTLKTRDSGHDVIIGGHVPVNLLTKQEDGLVLTQWQATRIGWRCHDLGSRPEINRIVQAEIAPNLEAGNAVGFTHMVQHSLRVIKVPADVRMSSCVRLRTLVTWCVVRMKKDLVFPALYAVYQDATEMLSPWTGVKSVGSTRIGLWNNHKEKKPRRFVWWTSHSLCGGLAAPYQK